MARVRYFHRITAGPHIAGIATPTNTVLPVITGDTAGQTCTTSDGTWSNASAFTYQWYLDGVLLAGQTANSIDTDAGWAGQTLSVVVYGGNGAGKIGASANGVVLQEAASYTGPLDIVPGAVVAYGQRALSAAKLGTALYTIRRDSDDATQSFNSDAVTGDAPVSDIATFLNGATGFVSVWNDQSPSSNNQATSQDQPIWTPNVFGGRPFLVGHIGGFGDTLLGQSQSTFPNGGVTIFIVSGPDTEVNVPAIVNNGYIDIYMGRTNNQKNMYIDMSDGTNEAGGEYAEATAICLMDAAWQYGSASLKVNGVEQSQLASYDNGGALGSITETVGIAIDDGILAELQDECAEIIIYPSVLSDADRLAIRQNIASYYGITLP